MKNNEEFQLNRVSIRLIPDAPLLSNEPVKSPVIALQLIGEYLGDFDREAVCVINLSASLMPLNFSLVSIGTIDHCFVSPREILKSAILNNAPNIIIMHNHPGGSLEPSKCDIEITKKILEACNMMDIKLIDHIITSRNSFYSFREQSVIDFEKTNYLNVSMKDISFPEIPLSSVVSDKPKTQTKKKTQPKQKKEKER